jgi:hypothetical protein
MHRLDESGNSSDGGALKLLPNTSCSLSLSSASRIQSYRQRLSTSRTGTWITDIHKIQLPKSCWTYKLKILHLWDMLTHLLPWVICSGHDSSSSVTWSANIKPLQDPSCPQLLCLLLLLKIHSPSGAPWIEATFSFTNFSCNACARNVFHIVLFRVAW